MAPCYATSDATRAHADRHAPPPAAPGQPALGGLDGARDRWGAGGRARPRRRRDGRVARGELRRRALHSRARGGGDGGRRDGGWSGDGRGAWWGKVEISGGRRFFKKKN